MTARKCYSLLSPTKTYILTQITRHSSFSSFQLIQFKWLDILDPLLSHTKISWLWKMTGHSPILDPLLPPIKLSWLWKMTRHSPILAPLTSLQLTSIKWMDILGPSFDWCKLEGGVENDWALANSWPSPPSYKNFMIHYGKWLDTHQFLTLSSLFQDSNEAGDIRTIVVKEIGLSLVSAIISATKVNTFYLFSSVSC